MRADLEATATPIGPLGLNYPPTAVGAGLIDATAAVGALALPPPAPVPPAAGGKPPADTTAPVASFSVHPKKLVKTRKAKVRLSFGVTSSESGSTFTCEFDGGRSAACPAKVTKAFGVGKHSVAVRATDAAGNVGKPAVFRFRVQRIQPKHHQRRGHRRRH